MKTSLKVILALGSFVLLGHFVVRRLANDLEISASYDDLESAKKGSGDWLPKFVPPSATAIREVHDLDTNATWGSFHFGNQDWARSFEPLRGDCRVPHTGSEGWPEQASCDELHQAGWVL